MASAVLKVLKSAMAVIVPVAATVVTTTSSTAVTVVASVTASVTASVVYLVAATTASVAANVFHYRRIVAPISEPSCCHLESVIVADSPVNTEDRDCPPDSSH